MKHKFLTIKLKTLLLFILCLLLLSGGIGTYFAIAEANTSPKPLHTIVIDAGHGGADVKKGQYVF